MENFSVLYLQVIFLKNSSFVKWLFVVCITLVLYTLVMKKISFVSTTIAPKVFGHKGLRHDIAIFCRQQLTQRKSCSSAKMIWLFSHGWLELDSIFCSSSKSHARISTNLILWHASSPENCLPSSLWSDTSGQSKLGIGGQPGKNHLSHQYVHQNHDNYSEINWKKMYLIFRIWSFSYF